MKKPSSKSSVHTRFVPGEEIATAQPWQFGAVSDMPLRGFRSPEREAADAASRSAQLLAERDAGYTAGLIEGRSRSQAELKQQMDDFFERQAAHSAQRMALCVQAFEARWAAVEQDLAQGVLELACALARQVLRREVRVDAHALEPALREAVALLGSDTKVAVVRLHPEDFGLLDDALKTAFVDIDLAFRADPEVAPGGCLVEAGGMSVDASLDKRWSRAVAALGLSVPWNEHRAHTDA